MTDKDTIAQILARSTVDAPRSTDLAELSELDRDEMETFKQAWSPLGPERRRHIISRLVELAEDNVELNFNEIFKLGLSDPDEEVRIKAIAGLWKMKRPPSSVPSWNFSAKIAPKESRQRPPARCRDTRCLESTEN